MWRPWGLLGRGEIHQVFWMGCYWHGLKAEEGGTCFFAVTFVNFRINLLLWLYLLPGSLRDLRKTLIYFILFAIERASISA